MKHTNKVKVTLLLAMFSLSIGVPAMSAMVSNVAAEEAQAKQMQDMLGGISGISDPSMIGGVLGGLIAATGAPDVFVEVLTLLFEQVYEFQDQQLLPGVYVLNASSSSTTDPVPYQESTSYYTWAPFQDDDGNYYRVRVERDIDVNVTITQELSVVAMLWDNDGSFVDILLRMLALYKDFENLMTNDDVGPEGEPLTEEEAVYLAGRVTEVLAYVLIHINDIITGDEQVIFQPSYYFSYDFVGDMNDTRTWQNASASFATVDPGDIPGLAALAVDDPYLQYLMDPGHTMVNDTLSNTGFIFQLYQLWMQKFQIQLDLGKLGAAITDLADENSTVGEETFANVLEGVEIAFAFTQHHLLGGGLFDDNNTNGIPDVIMEGTGVNYTDSDGEEKEVLVPTSSELKYILDLASAGDGWDVKPPTVNTTSGVPEIEWSVKFVNPTVYFKPVGMNHYAFHASGGAQEYDLEYLEFGFSFEPTSTMVIVRNEINEPHTLDLREGKVKLDHAFGDFTLNGTSDPLPSSLSDLALSFFYVSNVFTFALDFSNVENQTASQDSVGINGSQGPAYNSYQQESGTLDFLDGSVDNTFLFASVDIAGPGYGPPEDPFRWDASTAIIPYALFEYSFEAQQTVANDAFSVGQGESEYRQQSLFVDMTSAWAFYCVAYPEWDGNELIHDPSFSIFMSLSVVPPWAAILIFVVIGSIAAVAIIMYVLKRPKNPLKREA